MTVSKSQSTAQETSAMNQHMLDDLFENVVTTSKHKNKKDMWGPENL